MKSSSAKKEKKSQSALTKKPGKSESIEIIGEKLSFDDPVDGISLFGESKSLTPNMSKYCDEMTLKRAKISQAEPREQKKFLSQIFIDAFEKLARIDERKRPKPDEWAKKFAQYITIQDMTSTAYRAGEKFIQELNIPDYYTALKKLEDDFKNKKIIESSSGDLSINSHSSIAKCEWLATYINECNSEKRDVTEYLEVERYWNVILEHIDNPALTEYDLVNKELLLITDLKLNDAIFAALYSVTISMGAMLDRIFNAINIAGLHRIIMELMSQFFVVSQKRGRRDYSRKNTVMKESDLERTVNDIIIRIETMRSLLHQKNIPKHVKVNLREWQSELSTDANSSIGMF